MSTVQEKARAVLKEQFEKNQVNTMAQLLERKDKLDAEIAKVEAATSDEDLMTIRTKGIY